ncbi:hypothetical protein [Micromonospora chersina]|uniref:hypothetical protein n=1 Tax=Micromonospora chersina TaxID=47854 RepID=UPI003723AF03
MVGGAVHSEPPHRRFAVGDRAGEEGQPAVAGEDGESGDVGAGGPCAGVVDGFDDVIDGEGLREGGGEPLQPAGLLLASAAIGDVGDEDGQRGGAARRARDGEVAAQP